MEKQIKVTKKALIFDQLQNTFGTTGTFRYTDIVIAALKVKNIISDASEYDHTVHRGYYACGITKYGRTNNYLYNPSKNDSRRLYKTDQMLYTIRTW